MTGIYIHVPFCAGKCIYCDFFSVKYQKELVTDYVNAVIRNLQAYAIQDPVDTIYFGGGTPSLLSASQISDILNACAKYCHISENPEITLEYNPSGNRGQYLHDLRQTGVNRLSIGTQSFSDPELKTLSRTHSVQNNIRTILTAYEQGFTNISCDLILAIPDQTPEILSQSLDILVNLPITHCSAYLLQVEEETALARNPDLLARLPDEDASVDLYLQTIRTLQQAGLIQYEISSFAKSGYQSRHNLKYWQCEPYLGIGAGAHSCYQGKRFCVPENIPEFCHLPKQEIQILSETVCNPEEKIMLALRTTDGISEKFINFNNPQAKSKIPLLIQSNYLTKKPNGHIALTPEGFAVSNAVIAELL
ncbi:MAG: radical SAM family heme chaperone HemW, partial [Oscillospiraceae bacterium]|nr:radical SAM family heme chaperone HemW [Oscillospiraceae bacterium]